MVQVHAKFCAGFHCRFFALGLGLGDQSADTADDAADERTLAALRLRLDLNQLPRPFQITALGNKEWSLGSDWKLWQATLLALPVVDAK